MLFGVNDSIFRNTDSIGVRLEDLKYKSKETILRICNWMGIKNENSLFEMTAQGKICGEIKVALYMPAFGEMPKSNNGKVFSKNDRFILETLFYPFNVSFGYVKEDLKKFKK